MMMDTCTRRGGGEGGGGGGGEGNHNKMDTLRERHTM